jgi:ATP-binding cassette subfamily B protein
MAEVLRPWPIKLIFDDVFGVRLRGRHLDLGLRLGVEQQVLLGVLILCFAAIAVLRSLLRHQRAHLTAGVSEKVLASIRSRLYSHILRLSPSSHDRHRSGDLLTRLTRDTGSLTKLLVESLFDISDSLLPLLGMVTVMLWMDWQLTLVALAISPFLLLVVMRFKGPITNATTTQRNRESQITSAISETLSAISVVQAFNRERYEDERFFGRNKASLKEGLEAARLTVKFDRLIDLILAVGSCVVLWLGAKKVLAGVLTPGDLLVFTAYLSRVYGPMARLTNLTIQISNATVSGERVVALLETEPAIQDAPGAVIAPPFRGGIGFEEVEFGYRPGQPVLKGVSFVAKPGQVVALVGSSGEGKSTIANLLLRFYDPVRGRILLDGTDIRGYTLVSLREQIAVVLQESILFATTIRENIAYGKLGASWDEIVAAARAANAHDFIMELEKGYDTILGERGGTISGGQKQRVAIARAIVRDAPILILDEPMAGLDVESEAVVRDALKCLMTGRTCVLITHDLEAVADADLILTLDDGRIVEQGTHGELLSGRSRYRELIDRQGNTASFEEKERAIAGRLVSLLPKVGQ